MSCPLLALGLPFLVGLLLAADRPWPPVSAAVLLLLPLVFGWRLLIRGRLAGAAA